MSRWYRRANCHLRKLPWLFVGTKTLAANRCVTLLLLAVVWAMPRTLMAEGSSSSRAVVNRVTMDVYVRDDSERCRELRNFLKELTKRRDGLDVVIHDVVDDLDARRRLYELCRQFHVEKPGLPAVHVMNLLRVGFNNSIAGQQAVESMLSIEVFTRLGCPRCRDAKVFLHDLGLRWPALRFDIRDIADDSGARDRMMQLAKHYRVQASSVPTFHLCRQLKTGWLGPTITGANIESIIRKAARPLPPQRLPARTSAMPIRERSIRQSSLRIFLPLPLAMIQPPLTPGTADDFADSLDDLPPETGLEGDDIDPLPELTGDEPVGGGSDPVPAESVESTEMEVPFLGRLNVEKLGMPVFTFLIGLVDGFNPCAMWVLMFLLSVLVNIRERKKIIIIAGTFVLVSGLAYYAFMAAWLNVFMLVGLDRMAQIILGCIGIAVGMVNVKDFFAFGRGVSFKIPESAKPGIYSRVRKIVAAKHVWAALSGAVVLAVLVNTIELLCTAGLPAMYTEILTLQEYSPFVNYLYLGLYIVAYMLDDSVLVTIVVATMSKKKLQEGEGRWLKLLSGTVILALGIVMIVKPSWLV